MQKYVTVRRLRVNLSGFNFSSAEKRRNGGGLKNRLDRLFTVKCAKPPEKGSDRSVRMPARSGDKELKRALVSLPLRPSQCLDLRGVLIITIIIFIVKMIVLVVANVNSFDLERPT